MRETAGQNNPQIFLRKSTSSISTLLTTFGGQKYEDGQGSNEPFLDFAAETNSRIRLIDPKNVSSGTTWTFEDDIFSIQKGDTQFNLSRKKYRIVKSLYELTQNEKRFYSSKEILENANEDITQEAKYLSQILKPTQEPIIYKNFIYRNTETEDRYMLIP